MFDPWVEKTPWRMKWQPTPVFLPGKSHGQRSLAGCSPWGRKRVGHDLATKQQHSPSYTVVVNFISTSFLLQASRVTVWITINCGKFFKRWEYQTTLPASCKTCMHVKKQQLELVMEQRTGSKLGKEYIKAVYCHTANLTYMKSTSCKMLGWMKLKLGLRLPEEISITSDMQMTPP